ncbi:class IV adenylate cyclase [Entomospira entomophila]|uniref:Class IV adenylate cyclase n=1 Tax=Entomospira entomophila TaxID=2719988 RepID=A0A968G876_9SPIO|nr:class IV adenylate cyclase [Entomospira entomophilus]NIZ40377.1 class IV adenylate cyclase [Entomospira entomophilus]WDI35936.1 class IV adenylate cyclase [Entomospira entomophilus]
MAYEVEIKAHITAEEYTQLKKKLSGSMEDKGFDEKHDVYFKRLEEQDERIRLRSCDSKGAVLTYKERHTYDGVEMNKEIEIVVDNMESTKRMLEAIGFVMSFKKTKMVHLFSDGKVQYELAEVAGLGLFLEIEKVIENEEDIQQVNQAKHEVKEILLSLGVNADRIEEKSYKKLLGYV